MKSQADQCDWVEKKCAYANKAKVGSWQLDTGDVVRSGDGWETPWWRPEDFEKVFKWDDSGALESFQIARDRHDAKLRNLDPIPLPSPDLYIQQVIWNGEGGGGGQDLPESANSLSPPKEANKTWQRKRGQNGVTRNAGYSNYVQSSSIAASSHWKSGEMEVGGNGWFDNPPTSRPSEISDNRDGAPLVMNEGWAHEAQEGGPWFSNEGCANQGRDGRWSVSNEGQGRQRRDGTPLVSNEGLGKQSRGALWVSNDGWGNQAEGAGWVSNEGWGNQGIDGAAPLVWNEGWDKQGRDRAPLVSNLGWGKQGIDGVPLVSNEEWGNQGINEAPLVSEGWSPQGRGRVPLVLNDGWGNRAGDGAPWVSNKGWGNQGIDGGAPLVSIEGWGNQDRDRAPLISNEGWGNQGRERWGNRGRERGPLISNEGWGTQGRERWGHQGRERVPLVSSEGLGNQGGERWGNRGRERALLVSNERWGNRGRERALLVSNERGEEGRNGAPWPDVTATTGRGFSRYRGNPVGPDLGALPRPPLTMYQNDEDQRNQSSASPSCPNNDQMIGQGVSGCRSGGMNNTNQTGSYGQYHPRMGDMAAGHGRRNWRKYRKAMYN